MQKGLQGNNSGITMKWWNRIKQLFDLIYSYKGLLEKSSKLNHISSQWWIFQRKEKTISFLILKGAERKKKRTWWFLSHLLQQWLLWRRALCATLKSGWRWAGSALFVWPPRRIWQKTFRWSSHSMGRHRMKIDMHLFFIQFCISYRLLSVCGYCRTYLKVAETHTRTHTILSV